MTERPDVEYAFNPELRQEGHNQAQRDFDLYLENRPYQDTAGATHEPNGKFIDAEAYHLDQRSIAEQNNGDAYESMTMSQLARKLAEAEFYKDRTTSANINEVLLEKLGEEELKITSERDAEHNEQRWQNLWNRVLGIKNKELARLQGANGQETAVEIDDEDTDANYENEKSVQLPEGAEKEPFSDPLKVKYNENEHGASFGWVFDKEGDNMDWAKSEHTNHENREIIMSTNDGDQIYVKGKRMYHMGPTKRNNYPYVFEMDSLDDLPPIKIGEPIALTGRFGGSSGKNGGEYEIGPITNVEIAIQPDADDVDFDSYQESGMDDPFEEAEAIIDAASKTREMPAVNGDEQSTQSMELVPYEPKNFRERMKLKFRQAKYGLMAFATNKAFETKEYFTDEEKGKRRKIIGAVAGVAAVGLAVWGASKLGSGQEMLDTGNPPSGNSGAGATGMEQAPSGKGNGNVGPDEIRGNNTANHGHELTASDLDMELGATPDTDTIWEQSENWLQQHGYEASKNNIDLVKDAVLRHHGITEAQATSLPVGYQFEIPQEVIDQLTKAKPE